MVLNLLALAGFIGFSLLIVLGVYAYRKGGTRHRTEKPTARPLVQPTQAQSKPQTSKLLNGKTKLADIAKKSLQFLNGKKEDEELEATPT
jgi:hypothetical protein